MLISDVNRAAGAFLRAGIDAGLFHIGDRLAVERSRKKEGIPWMACLVHNCEGWPKGVPLINSKVEGIDLDGCFTAEQAYLKLTAATYALDAVTRMNRTETQKIADEIKAMDPEKFQIN